MKNSHDFYVIRGKSYRKAIVPGDVFEIRLPTKRSIVGRVAMSPIDFGVTKGCILIYIYKDLMQSIESVRFPKEPELLFPTMFVLNVFWHKGIFRHLYNRPLTSQDLLKRHVFKTFTKIAECDEYGMPLTKPISNYETYGYWRLEGWKTLDDNLRDMQM